MFLFYSFLIFVFFMYVLIAYNISLFSVFMSFWLTFSSLFNISLCSILSCISKLFFLPLDLSTITVSKVLMLFVNFEKFCWCTVIPEFQFISWTLICFCLFSLEHSMTFVAGVQNNDFYHSMTTGFLYEHYVVLQSVSKQKLQ